jgi:hypothetical protein
MNPEDMKNSLTIPIWRMAIVKMKEKGMREPFIWGIDPQKGYPYYGLKAVLGRSTTQWSLTAKSSA